MKVIIEDVNGPTKQDVYLDFTKCEPEDTDIGEYRDMIEEIELDIEMILRIGERGKK